MTIMTPYNINEDVYIIYKDAIKEAIIYRITIKAYADERIHTNYVLQINNGINVDIEIKNIYKTKEEAAIKWLEKQGLKPNITRS